MNTVPFSTKQGKKKSAKTYLSNEQYKLTSWPIQEIRAGSSRKQSR